MTVITKSKIEFINAERTCVEGSGEIGFNDREEFIVLLNRNNHDTKAGAWGYGTSIAISPRASRNEHGSKVYVRDCGEIVFIADDFGHEHAIKAEREVLEALLRECVKQDIPLKSVKMSRDMVNRVTRRSIPGKPSICDMDCVYAESETYAPKGCCDDPRTNKGNSDAKCYRMNNRDIVEYLYQCQLFFDLRKKKNKQPKGT